MIEGDNVNRNDCFSQWRQCYNESSMRKGLLAWYNFKKDSRILEAYPQGGALTGFLASKCRELVCIIRSENDRQSLEKRFADMGNIKYKYIEEIEGAFDYIVAYDPFYYYEVSRNVTRRYKEWHGLLAPEGTLLLSVRNIFSPLSSLSAKNSINRGDDIVSLKKELGEQFSKTKSYYVYPDMVFPQEIYTDECEPDRNIAYSVIPYSSELDNSHEYIWDFYRKAFDVMDIKNIAGAFLMECTNAGEVDDAQRIKITSDRENGMLTVIRKDKVEKAMYDDGQTDSLKNIMSNHKKLKEAGINAVELKMADGKIEMPIIKAPLLKDVLLKLDDSKALKLWERFFENIEKSSKETECAKEWNEKYSEHNWGKILKTGYIEMSPLNCFYDKGDLIFFDQEYTMENCPMSFIVFRSIVHVYGDDSKSEVFETLKKRYGIDMLWDVYMRAELEFLGSICKDKNKVIKDYFFSYNQYLYEKNQRMSVQAIKYLFSDMGDKEIVCYGAGNGFKHFMNGYGRICKIAFVVDSNPQLVGKSVCGIQVKSPAQINPNQHRVIITSRSIEEIKHKLISMNVEDYRYLNRWE